MGQAEVPAQPTYLCCQVVPRGQVLEPEEAVPVASSPPAGIVLHHLRDRNTPGMQHRAPPSLQDPSFHVQGRANTTRAEK